MPTKLTILTEDFCDLHQSLGKNWYKPSQATLALFHTLASHLTIRRFNFQI